MTKVKILATAIAVMSLLASLSAGAVCAREKVLLDADMVDGFDDGVAMIMLANAPGIDLLGVTIVSGNSWAAGGLASAIRQLEIEGKTGIQPAMGFAYPRRPGRQAGIAGERRRFGIGSDPWTGAFGLKKITSWRSEYIKRYGGAPIMKPDKRHAVDFIIDTIRNNPNAITIASIGPCSNLAAAVRKAPDIVPLIKRIVYMGGAFYQPGNVTPTAEFNWWFDPEAAKILLRTPFAEQIIVSLDVCEKVLFRKQHYDRLARSLGGSGQLELLRSSFAGRMFEKDPGFTTRIWDVVAAAVIIDPSLVAKEVVAFVDVDDRFGISYGQSIAWPEQGPEGSRQARIILEVDQDRLWNMINDRIYWKSAR